MGCEIQPLLSESLEHDSEIKMIRDQLRDNKLVFVVGNHGSGKSSISKKLSEKYRWTLVQITNQDRYDESSPELICKTVSKKIYKVMMQYELESNDKYLISGFPGSLDEAHAFENLIGEPNWILYVQTDQNVCNDRYQQMLGNTLYSMMVIKRQIERQSQCIQEVVEYYRLKGQLKLIDGNQDKDAVQESAEQANIHTESELATQLKERLAKAFLVFVIRCPGSDQKNQFADLAKNKQWIHISTSQLILNEVQSESILGQITKKYTDQADYAPAWIVCQLVSKAILNQPSDFYIIDGFPKNFSQANCIKKIGKDPDKVIFLSTPQNTNKSFQIKKKQKDQSVLSQYRQQFEIERVINVYKQKRIVCELDSTLQLEKIIDIFLLQIYYLLNIKGF